MSAIRWHLSASSMYGVEIRIDKPSAARCARASQNSRRDTGSTPVVGSSSTSTRGWGTKAQASESFCFIPPLNCPARRTGESIHVEHLQILAASLHDVVGCDAAQIADVANVFENRKIGVQAECLSQIACLERASRAGWPKTSADPEVASMTPARIWNVEVFPAPSGPIKPKISPSPTSKLIPRTASSLP